MRKMYLRLFELNGDLIAEYTKRANNHQQLLDALKEVNQMIQRAAKLRVGAAKTRIVATCREAIRTNNIHQLVNIIKYGHA